MNDPHRRATFISQLTRTIHLEFPTPRVRFTAMAMLLFALLCGTSASAAQVISFEEIAASGPGGGTGTPVLNFYAARGVIFKAAALDYSRGIAIPGFAHSGTKAIETCIAAEFCSAPIEATFTQAQRRVKVWAGFSSALSQPITVVVRAFAGNGTQVGQASATLAVNTAPTNIQTPLEITSASANIVRVDASLESGGAPSFTNGLAIDDLEFDTNGSPPACAATTNPTLSVGQPFDGQQTQFNQFTLAFNVATNDPFAVTTVTATAGAQAHTATYAGFNGQFGPTSMGDFLFAGSNTLTIAVKDCFGMTQQTRTVIYAPIASDERLHVQGIEATQVVQNVPSSVTLVADKPTLVRVYLYASGSTPTINNVRGTLFAYRPLNNEQTRGPAVEGAVHSTNVINVNNATDIRPRRLIMNESLNFEIPAEWITAGAINFVVRFDADGSPTSPLTIPCEGCDNTYFNGAPVFSHFIAMPTLRVRIVALNYLFGANGTTPTVRSPRTVDTNLLQSWVRRAFPAGNFDFTTTTLMSGNAWPFDCHQANAEISALRSTEVNAGRDSHTHYISQVINDGGFMRGCTSGVPDNPDTTVVSSSPTGNPGIGAGPHDSAGDTDSSWGDYYGGHELGHQFGRKHPGFCDGNSSDDDHFPNPNGQISDNLQTYVGLDKGDSANSVTQKIISPFASDNMTYCTQPRWWSAYNYLAIMQRLRAENNFPALMSFATSASANAAPAAEMLTGDLINVVATVNMTQHTGQIRHINHVSRATAPVTQPDQSAAIQLRDKNGRVIKSFPTWVRIDSDIKAGEDQTGIVQLTIPADAATAHVDLLLNGNQVATRAVSAHAPIVTRLRFISEPLPCGCDKGRQRVLTWEASDADKDALTYLVQVSAERDMWDTLAVSLKRNRLILTPQQLEGFKGHTLRVIASDGYNESKPATLKVAAK